VTRVRHCHAVNVVRLWYEGRRDSAVAPWISERLTYRERGKEQRWHVPDGVVKDPRSADEPGPDRFIAVEVELTHKGRRAYETEVFGNLRAGVETLWFLVPDEPFARRLRADAEAVLTRMGSTRRFGIELLPEVPGVSYMDR
jgi:hypothetical protein